MRPSVKMTGYDWVYILRGLGAWGLFAFQLFLGTFLPELMVVFVLTSQACPPAAFCTLLVTLEFAFQD